VTIANLITRECVLILRDPTGTRDDYGNETTLDYTDDSLCELQQRSANERDDSGESSDDDWNVFFLTGTDLTTASAVQVDGDVYEFVGAPWTVRHPITGADSHIEVKARRTAGAEDGS
jgi:hypothetical protein